MELLDIRLFDDPVLRSEAREVDTFDERLSTLAKRMLATMREAPGVGLAANQVGILKRLFTFQLDDEGDHGAVVNPEVVDASEESAVGDEGCLSFPGMYFDVERPLRVEVAYRDLSGDERKRQLTEFEARVWLHEIDHLRGVLFIDHLAAHDAKEARRQMRAYRQEHGTDMPGQGELANLLLKTDS